MKNVPLVGVIVGSIRKDSLNLKLALNLQKMASPELDLSILTIDKLPLYNPDLDDGDVPAAWAQFRQSVAKCSGILFISPEHNRSVPAALKNAIDIGSRPYGHSVWKGKPCGVISLSPGGLGAFGANHHLRQSLVFLDMPVLQQPEAYIGNAAQLFDQQGTLVNESSKTFFTTFLKTFSSWVDLHQK